MVANLSASEFERAFTEAAENATAIVFDLSDLDVAFAMQNGLVGFVSRNYTNAELMRVIQNPKWLAKTTFNRNGRHVVINSHGTVL